jgi:hypothetical protein
LLKITALCAGGLTSSIDTDVSTQHYGFNFADVLQQLGVRQWVAIDNDTIGVLARIYRPRFVAYKTSFSAVSIRVQVSLSGVI